MNAGRAENHHSVRYLTLMMLSTAFLLLTPPTSISVEPTIELGYSVSFNGIPVGSACFAYALHDTASHYTVTLTVQTNDFASSLYSIRNTYVTVIDAEDLFPLSSRKSIDQKKFQFTGSVDYNYDDGGTICYSGKGISVKGARYHTFFSIIHLISRMTQSRTDTLMRWMVAEGTSAKFTMVHDGDEKITIGSLEVPCQRMNITFSETKVLGRPYRKTDIITNHILDDGHCWTFWFAADRILPPVKIRYRRGLFSFTATANAYTGIQ
jgi:hypothetical protein